MNARKWWGIRHIRFVALWVQFKRTERDVMRNTEDWSCVPWGNLEYAYLEADHRRLAEDVREQVAEAGIEISRGWFYKQVWSVVRKELGIRGAGIRAGRRSA